MEVNQALPPSANQPPGQAANASALSSDFETFLVMLTTQMENQDPLNPIESSDFAVQLATFSGVEQQVRTNDLLASMAASTAMADLSSWVGLSARVEGPIPFSGQPVTIDTGDEFPGTSRQLVVRGPNGTILSTEGVPPGTRSMEWVGRDASGRPLSDGAYDLTIERMRGDEVIAVVEVASYSTVVEARRSPNGTELLLENGNAVSADEVDALRAD